MKDEEKKPEVAWEARDPEVPVIHSSIPGSRSENHRRH